MMVAKGKEWLKSMRKKMRKLDIYNRSFLFFSSLLQISHQWKFESTG